MATSTVAARDTVMSPVGNTPPSRLCKVMRTLARPSGVELQGRDQTSVRARWWLERKVRGERGERGKGGIFYEDGKRRLDVLSQIN
jgi:hypothetical protein